MSAPVKDQGAARDAGFDPWWYPWNDARDHTFTAKVDGWVRIKLWGGASLPEVSQRVRENLIDGPDGYTITRRGTWTGGQLRLRVDANPGGATGYTAWFDWDASAASVAGAIHALGGDAADVTVDDGPERLPWSLSLPSGSGFRLGVSDNSMLTGSSPRAQVGSHAYEVMYRVWLESGDRLRVRLGGRPTVTASRSPGSWGAAGDLEDFEAGRAIRGGWPDGGDGVEQSLTVMYGRTIWPWYTIAGGYLWGPPTDPTGSRELTWRCNGGGGASRVWLTPRPGDDGEPKEERLLIVEPGEGSRPIFTRVLLDQTGDESFTDDGPADPSTPHLFSGSHRYALKKAPRSEPLALYGESTLHPTSAEETAMYECAEYSVPIPASCFAGWTWDGEEWGAWGDMDAATVEAPFFSYGAPVKENDPDSSSPPSASSAPEYHALIDDGDPPPTPPAEDEPPRAPGPPLGSPGLWPDPYPLAPAPAPPGTTTSADTRTGAAGGESNGANGQPSAYGPRRPGGGGFGGGAAGDVTESMVQSTGSVTGGWIGPVGTLGAAGLVLERHLRQWPAKSGGRWWNDARVDATGTWVLDLADDDPLHADGTLPSGPLPSGDPPLDDPWLIGFGAMWLCGEEPTGAKRTRWRVGHVGWGRNDGW